jgi:hypothetical protein
MQYFYKSIIVLAIFSTNILLGNKVNILYTANINATYENCNCGSDPLGGIDRLKTYVDNFRSNNKNTIVIDGGNFFNSYPHIDLNTKALESLTFLNYDLFAVGVHIFSENKIIYDQLSKKYREKLINSNSNLNLNASKDFTIDHVKLRIFSYISPDLFKYSPKPEWLILQRDLKHDNYLEDGINILVYNGQFQNAKVFLKQNTQYDLVLLSSDQQEGTWKSGKSIIVGGGHDAESIAMIEIMVKNNSPSISVSYSKMDNSISSDRNILSIFNSNKEKLENKMKEF